MQVFESLDNLPRFEDVALTIGVFDGVHIGHQKLLEELKKKGRPAVLTFSNHPLEVIRPVFTPSLILTPAEKMQLLEQFGVEIVLSLPFTEKIAKTPYDLFIYSIRAALPFKALVLGENARLGAGARGTNIHLKQLGKVTGFETLFVPPVKIGDEPVCSSQIRVYIRTKEFDQARTWLGHSQGIPCQTSEL